jgi:hypothetical protein
MLQKTTFIFFILTLGICARSLAKNLPGKHFVKRTMPVTVWKYYDYYGSITNGFTQYTAFAIAYNVTTPATITGTSTFLSGNATMFKSNNNQIAVMNQLWHINSIENIQRVRLYYNNTDKLHTDRVHTNPLTQQSWCLYAGTTEAFLKANNGDLIDGGHYKSPDDYGYTMGKSFVDFLHINANTTIAYITKSSLFATLPAIKLNYYNVVEKQCMIHLKWESANEEVSAKYVIEKSTNGIYYVNIDTIKGQGDYKAYTFDFEYSNDINYCRLKVINESGAITYGDNTRIHATCNGQSLILFPNPAIHTTYISGLLPETLITILDAYGNTIRHFENNRSIEPIDVSSLLPGTYFIDVKDKKNLVNKKNLLRLIKK